MRRLRVLLAFCLAALLMACQPPAQVTTPAVVPASPLLQGQVLLPSGFQVQANAGQVRANATVTLIDPATFQAKGTGITASDGTFTVQALNTFTPTLGSLYLLESNKTLGGAGNAAFRLRTLVQYTASGWTSVTGSAVQVSSATTAVAILWDRNGLTGPDVLSKVSYDALTRTHRFNNLTSTLTEGKLREVEGLVSDALLLGADPIQVVRPGPDGRYRLALSERSRNQLVNPGFEVGASKFPGWSLNNPAIASYSAETNIVYEASQSLKLTVNGGGDTWFGQGFNGTTETFGLKLATGTAYTFSLYARGAVGGEKLAMAINYQAPFLEALGPIYTLTTTWQRYTWTLVSAYSTDRAFFLLRNGSGVNQTTFPASVYVDALQLEEGGAATDYQEAGTLLQEGFANALESTGVTPTQGRTSRGVMVESWLNLIPTNSSFEADSNADGLPDGMSMSYSGGTYSLDTDCLFDVRSLKIVKASATPDYVGYNLPYTFKPGKTYTFSVWVKGQGVSGGPSNNDFGIYVDAYPAAGGGVEAFTVAAPTGTFDWTRISVTHTFIRECSGANFDPIFRNKTGTAWFDGMQVEESAQPSPYAGNYGGDRLSFDATRYNPYQGTVSFWYKPTFTWMSDRDVGDLFGLVNGQGNQLLVVSKLANSNGTYRLNIGAWDGSASHGGQWNPTGTPWLAGTWHHVALTWGFRGVELYVDGEPVATVAGFGPLNAGKPFSRLCFAGTNIGANYVGATSGALDGLKVWDTQKSPEAVRREYLGLTP